MHETAESLVTLQAQIQRAAQSVDRDPRTIQLVAVSKGRSWSEIKALADCGQTAFGENYLQEAVSKIEAAQQEGYNLEWHFMGRLQKNKCAMIAQYFHWVHSLSSIEHARVLNQKRVGLPPLAVCIQVNITQSELKAGVHPEALSELIQAVSACEHLKVCGLMTILEKGMNAQECGRYFTQLRQLRDQLNQECALELDTLSMGMSEDYFTAVQQGATILRIGRALFEG